MGGSHQSAKWHVIGRAVCGAAHRRNTMPLQDAICWLPAEGSSPWLALALADGHGSPVCFRSKQGADLAVGTAALLLRDFHLRHPDCDGTDLQRVAEEEISKPLVSQWRQSVMRQLEQNPLTASELDGLEQKLGSSAGRALEADPVLAYGSTALAALATPAYSLLLQLGDGDCLIVSRLGETFRPWSRDTRLLGVETTSLCMHQAWNEVRLCIRQAGEDSAALLLLCTDGYSNSFRDDEGFLNVGRDFLELIRSEGIEKVNEHLDEWLAETTENGSGDDVSLGILWREEEPGLTPPSLPLVI